MTAAAVHSFAAARTLVYDVLALSKYRLSGMVALTASAGYALRSENSKDYYRQLGAVTAGTWLTAACANSLNQLYEIRSDALMARTRLRPLPAGRLPRAFAAAYAAATGLAGVALLQSETNSTAAGLAAANVALYAGLYTPLKAISTMNTWVGAVVGAIPPLLGWAAASDGKLVGERERGGWALASLLLLWQIPHFHALAVVARGDYAAGGLKMLAVSNPVTNAMWARYLAWTLVPMGAVMTGCGVTSEPFAWEMGMLGWWMVRGAGVMEQSPTKMMAARPLFRASIVYLPVSLMLMMVHRVPWGSQSVQYEPQKEVRYHQPWEIIAPFPFLPVPMGAPAVVVEVSDR